MKPTRGHDDLPSPDAAPREVTFAIIDSPGGSAELLNADATGTLLDLDEHGISLRTRVPVEPGNILRLCHGGVSKVGIVMWSVESAEHCRIQVRFV
jgi:hypothetical protein